MPIAKKLSSLGRALAYFFGVRPRRLVLGHRNLKGTIYLASKLCISALNSLVCEMPQKRGVLNRPDFFPKVFLKSIKEDFRSIFEPLHEGPRTKRFGRVKCKTLHRVSVRSFFDALSTTESEEIVDELGAIDTTHSSIIDSEDLSFAK